MAEPQIVQWKRLSIEAVAIVASILFAFAIDAWWDERNERQYEQDALLGLESEYEDHRKTIDRQIEVLSNLELRYALSAWDSVLDEVIDGQIFSRNLVRESFIPLLSEKGIAVAHGAHDKSRHPWPVSTRPISTFGDMQARLFADEIFCSMLDHRYAEMNHTLDEYEDLSQVILEILAMIRGSLGESAS